MKEYVLISQGVEIYRTRDKSDAVKRMTVANVRWRKYQQKCRDNGEAPADNEVFLEEEDVAE